MTNKSQEKLRSLLKSYEERAAKPQPEQKAVDHEAEQTREACGERLQQVVASVLRGFMVELRNAGHEASIEDHTDAADAYPTVTLTFTPRTPAWTALASALAFKCDPRRGIAVARDIRPSAAKAKVVTTSTDRIGTMKPEAVSAEWVETKTLSFIEAVLKAN